MPVGTAAATVPGTGRMLLAAERLSYAVAAALGALGRAPATA